MHDPAQKQRIEAVNLALAATVALSVMKLAVAAVSGSVGMLSEAIHSALDLVSSLITRVTVSVSHQPADENHPFGHGKLETLSALFEAFLLIVAGIYIVYEAFVHAHAPHEIKHMGWAMGVTVLSMVVNVFVYVQNRGVGREHESLAIETNAFHFLTDFFSSAVLLIGLATVEFADWPAADAVAAGVIAVYIFWVAAAQIRKCVQELSDEALPAEEVQRIEGVIGRHSGGFLDYHDLRTRKVGAQRHVEMHLTVCSELTVSAAHGVCDGIEAELEREFGEGAHVSIHTEPCGHHNDDCARVCMRTEKPRSGK